MRGNNNYKCMATMYISHDAGLTERLQACNCINNYHSKALMYKHTLGGEKQRVSMALHFRPLVLRLLMMLHAVIYGQMCILHVLWPHSNLSYSFTP